MTASSGAERLEIGVLIDFRCDQKQLRKVQLSHLKHVAFGDSFFTAELLAVGASMHVALFVHLYLADMGHFAAANVAYCGHFPAVSPSARACVQAQLPAGCPVMVEVLVPSSPEGTSI